MKRSEMICSRCINRYKSIKPGEVLCKLDPVVRGKQPDDWCGRGSWFDTKGKQRFWGQWSDDDVSVPSELPRTGEHYMVNGEIRKIREVFWGDSGMTTGDLDLSCTVVIDMNDGEMVVMPWSQWLSKMKSGKIHKLNNVPVPNPKVFTGMQGYKG